MADISTYEPGIGIKQALDKLPLESPEQSAWPLLAKNLPKKKTPRRYLPMALAAGMALVALIPFSLDSPHTTESPVDASLESAMRQSSQLENILLATRNSTASSASAEVIGLALEDRIHAIDVELGSGTLNTKQQLDLWQQRVGILQEATGIYSSQRYQQAQGQLYEVALVESY